MSYSYETSYPPYLENRALNNEVWKDVPGYEGEYQASNLGNIKSLERIIIRSNGRPITIKEKILKLLLRPDGYFRITIRNNKNILVHRFVALAFIEKPFNKSQINHKNSLRHDNRIENLEWCTQSENNFHSYRDGSKEGPSKNKFGALNPRSKSVIQTSLSGEFIARWDSIKEIKRKTKFSPGNICQCLKGRFNQAYGYKWEYSN